MQNLFSVLRLARDQRRVALVFCVGIILLISSFAEAQSGRRPPKRTESEGVQKSTEPEPTTKQEAKPEKEQTPVMIVKSNSSYGVYYADEYVVEGCAARLKQSSALQVQKHPNEMNRKEAGDAAKVSANRYVVFLEMSSDRMRYNRDRMGREYIEDAVIDYTVFTPGTGKIKTSGRVYQMRPRGGVGGVGVPLPVPSGPATVEYTLKQAGRDVADRIIDSLTVITPPPKN